MPTIRIDDQVWDWLRSKARPFEDTPNSVLRRVAGLDRSPERPSPGLVQAQPVRRRERGVKTSQDSFRAPILGILLRNGGRGDRTDVLRQLEQEMSTVLTDFDRRDIRSGTIRWQKSAEWEVSVMRKQGLLLPRDKSPYGVWCLSPEGEKLAHSLEKA